MDVSTNKCSLALGLFQEVGACGGVTPAPREFGSIAQDQLVVAVEPRVDLGDHVDVDEMRTMDASEVRGVEPAFERFKGGAQRVCTTR